MRHEEERAIREGKKRHEEEVNANNQIEELSKARRDCSTENDDDDARQRQ